MSAAPLYAIEAPADALDLVDRMASPLDRRPLALTKRAAFFLGEMLDAGEAGITTVAYPGVRVGDAVHKLRKAGVAIETQHEPHGGEFRGTHGRYVLRSRIVRLDMPPGGLTGAPSCMSTTSGARSPETDISASGLDVRRQCVDAAGKSSGVGIPTPTTAQATP